MTAAQDAVSQIRTSWDEASVHLIVTLASQTKTSLGRQTIFLSPKPDRRPQPLPPVALRQIGTTGKISLHRAPKSVA